MSVFLDTNVLVYAGVEAEDVRKRDLARDLLERSDCVISVQVLQEFIVQATRSSGANPIRLEEAMEYVAAWRRFPIQETTLTLLAEGLLIQQRCKMSHWDAMIVAAGLALGCDTLYTEDMQHGRIIEGLRIVNPFR